MSFNYKISEELKKILNKLIKKDKILTVTINKKSNK